MAKRHIRERWPLLDFTRKKAVWVKLLWLCRREQKQGVKKTRKPSIAPLKKRTLMTLSSGQFRNSVAHAGVLGIVFSMCGSIIVKKKLRGVTPVRGVQVNSNESFISQSHGQARSLILTVASGSINTKILGKPNKVLEGNLPWIDLKRLWISSWRIWLLVDWFLKQNNSAFVLTIQLKLSLHTNQMAHHIRRLSAVSMYHETTMSISAPHSWDASPLRGYPGIKFAGTHFFAWVQRGNAKIKCLAQEFNPLSVPGQGSIQRPAN